jgi:hypothetical protein
MVLHGGLIVVPFSFAVVNTVSVTIATIAAARSGSFRGLRLHFGDYRLVWEILRGPGKWVWAQEYSWKWFDVVRVALLNLLFPATILGYVFAAESLSSYALSVYTSAQPVLQTYLANILDKTRAVEIFTRVRKMSVPLAWTVGLASIPALYILVHLLFGKYINALAYYPFYVAVFPCSAIAFVLVPYWNAHESQRLLFRLSCERYAVELSVTLAVYLAVGSAYAIPAANFLAAYFFLLRRLQKTNLIPEKGIRAMKIFLPDREGVRDLAGVAGREVRALLLRFKHSQPL